MTHYHHHHHHRHVSRFCCRPSRTSHPTAMYGSFSTVSVWILLTWVAVSCFPNTKFAWAEKQDQSTNHDDATNSIIHSLRGSHENHQRGLRIVVLVDELDASHYDGSDDSNEINDISKSSKADYKVEEVAEILTWNNIGKKYITSSVEFDILLEHLIY